MIFKVFSTGPFDTNTYIVGCSLTKKAFVVDVPPDSFFCINKFLKEKELQLEYIFLTHSHLDHVADVYPLKQATDGKVYVHLEDAKNLQVPGSDGLPLLFSYKGVEPDGFFEDRQKFLVGSFCIEVLYTPGHTPGGVSLFLEKEGMLFSGDTLFKGSMGRIDFPTARREKMWVSLKNLGKLPPDTEVFPGHGPKTTIRNEPWIQDAKKIFG